MNTLKVAKYFLAVLVVVILFFVLFGYAKPLSVDNSNLQQAVAEIELKDTCKLTDLKLNPVGQMTLDGKEIDYQTLLYTSHKDSITSSGAMIVELKKGFMKYKFVKLHEIKK